jgi:hypothetical protein
LLVTLTLLSFVVLLLVGLATYVRIETAISSNTQRQTQARQNALLALDVALGQLQLHAGPDQRVTATAESISGVNSQKRHYTGVWDTTTTGAAPVWLVSGLETATAPNVTTAIATASQVALVGANTDGTASLANGNPGTNQVVVPLQTITTVGVPGQSTTATIGRYAWWVGDQGLKAAVAVADKSGSVGYPPWTDTGATDLRDRIRQQISLGAGPSSPAGVPVFEPRDTSGTPSNATMTAKIMAPAQLAFFHPANASSGAIGLSVLRARYHDWSPNNFNVLANTADGGLRRDLSIDASPLGAAAQAWLDYPSYMEDPAASATSAFPPLPPFSADPLRRRYAMQPEIALNRIAPVLSFFGLSFSFRNNTANTGFEVASRCVVGLWNPYTSAFVPENLELVITGGLPDVMIADSRSFPRTVQLQALLGSGGGLKFLLPFTANNTDADHSTWLPGRVYNWSASSAPGRTGSVGNSMEFYVRDSTPTSGGSGVVWSVGPPLSVDSSSQPASRQCFIGTPTTLKIELRRASDGLKIASFNSATFESISIGTNPMATDAKSFDFAFIFRLPDGVEIPTGASAPWLQAAGRDPRETLFPASGYLVPGGNGNLAEQFGGPSKSQFTSSYVDQLLDRAPSSMTYNEDVPVFELPRAPLLSLGALQHLAIDGARPFSIGNSWGATTPLNGIPSAQLFDRFFFSGLVPAVTPTGSGSSLVLPNPLLRVSPRKADGTATTAADLRNAANATSSQFLLQGGAFNLNSTSPAAWAAVLRSVRFPAPAAFNYVDSDANTGTASTSDEKSLTPLQSGDAQFFRFSQSAQETYKAEAGLAAGATTPSSANTHLFRNGVITLNALKVTALATAITTAIKAYHAISGPFRSLEAFLSPAAAGGTSLLEQAIADANINVDADGNPIEFSSQFLTQGDIMTALAPVLFPRSDTFVIRTYGEAVNPNTGVTEGRAWCEATVQRTPDYFDPTDDATVAPADLNATNQTYGRRFKVVSFRWLTRSDI